MHGNDLPVAKPDIGQESFITPHQVAWHQSLLELHRPADIQGNNPNRSAIMPEKNKTDKQEARKKAIALRYDRERDRAPVVVARGKGLLAERLIALAKEHHIPIHEDSDLAEILARLDLNAEIPPATYVLVAEILAFVYRANQRFSR